MAFLVLFLIGAYGSFQIESFLISFFSLTHSLALLQAPFSSFPPSAQQSVLSAVTERLRDGRVEAGEAANLAKGELVRLCCGYFRRLFRAIDGDIFTR